LRKIVRYGIFFANSCIIFVKLKQILKKWLTKENFAIIAKKMREYRRFFFNLKELVFQARIMENNAVFIEIFSLISFEVILHVLKFSAQYKEKSWYINFIMP
jgi:hypothetical protein